MRYNEKELIHFSSGKSDKEGRMTHKTPGFRETYKERWFKLRGNLLFYFRLNEYRAVYETEPVGLLVIEQCRIQPENYAELPFAFSITFEDDKEKRHYFSCPTQQNCDEWIKILREASYEHLRTKLLYLQEKIIRHTGRDPLETVSKKWSGQSDIASNSSGEKRNFKCYSAHQDMPLINFDESS